MVSRTGLTSDRYVASKLSAQLGIIIQADIGAEFAAYIRAGGNCTQALDHFGVQSKYPDRNREVCLVALRKAASGHKGSFGVPAYEGLIPPKERKALVLETRLENGRITVRDGLGIHGLTKQKRIEYATIGGKASKESGKGALALSAEDKAKNGRLAIKARGMRPWEEEHLRYVFDCSQNTEYALGSMIDCARISRELKERFNEERNPRSVSYTLLRIKRRIAKAEAKKEQAL